MRIWGLGPVRMLRAMLGFTLAATFAWLAIAFVLPTGSVADAQDDSATIEIGKTVEGIDNDPTDFAFTFTGPGDDAVPIFVSLDDDATNDDVERGMDFTDLAPGTYTIEETPDANYRTTIDCDRESGEQSAPIIVVGHRVTVEVVDGDYWNCSFTNRDLRVGQITVEKTIQGDDEFEDAEFDFTIEGPSIESIDTDFTLSDDDDDRSFEALDPGAYTITELTQGDDFVTNFVCTDQDTGEIVAGGDDINSVVVNLAGGQQIECEVFNLATSSSITVHKSVHPSGADTTPFSFTIVGPDNFSDTFILDDSNTTADPPRSRTFDPLPPGIYTITETVQPPYETRQISCFSTGTGAQVEDQSFIEVELGIGEQLQCTFSNVRLDQTRLDVFKNVVPEGDPSDFTFTLVGPNDFETTFMLDDDPNDGTLPNFWTDGTLAPGTYTLTESPVAGFSPQVSCRDTSTGNEVAVGGAAATIDLAPGGYFQCHFTNGSETMSRLRIFKDSSIFRDETPFTFTLAGPNDFETTFVLDDDNNETPLPSFVEFDVAPGTYTLTELDIDGYNTTILCFVEQDFGVDTELVDIEGRTATFDVPAGTVVVCDVDNTDTTTARVELIKHWEPRNRDVDRDRTTEFTVTYPNGDEQVINLVGRFEGTSIPDVVPGTYTVAETPVDGFVTSIECGESVSEDQVAPTVVVENGTEVTFTVAGGERIACIFTNTNLSNAIVTVDKEVRGSFLNNPVDFEFTMTGPNGFSQSFVLDDDRLSNFVDSERLFADLEPGRYEIVEAPVPGFTTTINCYNESRADDGDSAPIAVVPDGSTVGFDLGPGATVQCDFKNRMTDATLIVEKDDTGDTGTVFDVRVSERRTIIAEGTISDDGSAPTSFEVPIVTGFTLTITERPTPLFTLDLDATTCSNQDGEIVSEFEFADDDKPRPGDEPEARELVLTIERFNVQAGDVITCRLVNNPDPGGIRIIKSTPGDSDPTDFAFTSSGGLSPASFSLDTDAGDVTLSDSQDFTEVPVGTYIVTETQLGRYAIDIVCDDNNSSGSGGVATIHVDPGENVTCMFINRPGGTITIISDTQPNDGTDFSYSTTSPVAPAVGGVGSANLLPIFVLDDDGDPTLPNQFVFSGELTGAHTITQAAVSGYTTSVSCTGGTTRTSGATATVRLAQGESVVCTFVNVRDFFGGASGEPFEPFESIAVPAAAAQTAVTPSGTVGGLAVTGTEARVLSLLAITVIGMGFSVGAAANHRRRTS